MGNFFFVFVAVCLVLVQAAPDNMGEEFIIAYMDNFQSNFQLELFVTTSRTTTVNVRVTSPRYSNPKIDESFTVTAGQVKQLFFNNNFRLINTEMSPKGILVSADDEVVIYGVNKETYSNDAFLGLPTDVLGTEYYAFCYGPAYRQTVVLVVATQDNTRVSLRLADNSGVSVSYNGRSYSRGSWLNVTMDRFDAFQIHSTKDLTSTYIVSDKPVSAFSGNKKTNIGSGGSQDHLVEQLVPVDNWGKKFVTIPIPERVTGDYFRIIPSEDNTAISVTGLINGRSFTDSFTISKSGTYVQKHYNSKLYASIEADKPIMLVQYVLSQVNDNADPAIMIIPPVEQYAADYTFATPKYSRGSYINYFMFVVDKSEKSGLRMDGSALASNTAYNDIPGTNFVGGYVKISEGTHTVRHTSPISIFGGYLYGRARLESYAFPTGMRLAPINTVCVPTTTVTGDGIDNDCDGLIDEELCVGANQGSDDDGDGVSDEDCAKPPPVDGNWASWTSWTTCSVSCIPTSGARSGTHSRSRTCSNPAPAYDGKQCSGDDLQSKSCTPTSSCAVNGNWASWGSWGSCSVTCASGSQSRTRTCTNPAPLNGGNDCSGSSSSTKTCTKSACPVDGNWANWASWGSCSVTCASGTQYRSRTCSNPAPQHNGADCAGSTSSSKTCTLTPCPIDGSWTSWASWGSCSVTCASGQQLRTRSCSNPAPQYNGADCAGSSSSTKTCTMVSCPVDGNWANWGSWGSCSVTCASGTQYRSRSCSNPAPQHNGADCAGSTSSSKTCTMVACPIDGNWADWGSWGSCSVTCASGTQYRSRSCSNPAPQHNGADCAGSTSSSKTCTMVACPIDGNWANWGSWGSCSVTCASGTQYRSRTCSNPAPQHNGAACAGSTSSSKTCTMVPCPIDGNWATWASWGSCSVTCASGIQHRSRTCTDPAPLHNGADCAGSLSSSQTCTMIPCPIDGNWGSWASWSSCSVTCASGIQSRSRSCNDPTPQHNGAYCSGSSTSIQTCTLPPCPIDGNWASWEAWGTCSVTCASGTHDRHRTCTDPAPMYNGANCVGAASATQTCTLPPCPIDGGWTSWTSWGTCTVTCGGGTQDRTRSCSNPTPMYGGASCSGTGSETQDCNTQVCIIDGAWSTWTAWGTCSVSCGGGHQSRGRSCTDPAPANGGLPCSGKSADIQDCSTAACPTPAAGQYVQLCPTGWFTCESGGITCIDKAFQCDCGHDCDDGSDETTGYASCSPRQQEACANGAKGLLRSSPLELLLVLSCFLLFTYII